MQKLLIKLIYFLLKFVKRDITSFEQFDKDMAKLAGDKYYVVKMERTTYSRNSLLKTNFSAYIEDTTWLEGNTPKEVLDKHHSHYNNGVDNEVQTVLD